MNIVLDTNVLVSGLLSPQGVPGRILDLVMEGEIFLIVDARIIHEYREVLSRPEWPFSKKDAFLVLDFILDNSFMVDAEPLEVNLADPDDLMFIEAALKARAFFLLPETNVIFPKGLPGKYPCSPLPSFWSRSKGVISRTVAALSERDYPAC